MKQIICIILGWFVLLTTAHAASFYCGKASTKIEKLICSSPKLSVLDEELTKSYQYALQNSRLGKNEPMVTAQKRWLKLIRNKCSDETCLNEVYSSRIKEINEIYPFFGVYQGFSSACQNSILTITPETIGLNGCRDLSYDIQESDNDHVIIEPRASSKCRVSILKLSREKPVAGMPIFGGFIVEWDRASCNFGPVDASMAEDQTVIFMSSKTAKGKEDALRKINLQSHPDRNKYNQIGIKDTFPEVRKTAAYMLRMELTKLTPILLEIMATDPDPRVRLSAALNLQCQFTCNGTEYTTKDIETLESDLLLLEKAFSDEIAGRYILEILDFVWCDITEKSRTSITVALGSSFPYGMYTPSIDDSTKKFLRHFSGKSCEARAAEQRQLDIEAIIKSRENAAKEPICGFPGVKLPAEFSVFAAGAYSGRKLSFQIDQSGHEGTQIDVAVNSPNKPVVLMLGAYEPTIWNIGWTRKTRILAVLVGGYNRQAVAGLAKSTPLLVSSFDNKGPCGFFYITPDDLAPLNPLSKRVFGHPVDMVFPATNGKVVVGEPMHPGAALFTSHETLPESFLDKTAPIAGPTGLEDAVSKGLLRKATAADAEAWSDAVIQNSPQRDIPPVAGQGIPKPSKPPIHNNTYVVLKAFTFPAGLYGGNSAFFLIPKGVPKPEGNPGHSHIYDFNTLKCQGLMCGVH
ncbi:MAG: hypothetical protein PHP70_06695 [Gallionella sp.]|nr:hypothetical protein [Gallionella sp.]